MLAISTVVVQNNKLKSIGKLIGRHKPEFN